VTKTAVTAPEPNPERRVFTPPLNNRLPEFCKLWKRYSDEYASFDADEWNEVFGHVLPWGVLFSPESD
jgi:hypothetical protein